MNIINRKINNSISYGLMFLSVFSFILVWQFNQPEIAKGDVINYIQKMSTTSAMLVTTSSAQVLGTSTARTYAAFVNDGANPVYIQLTGNPAKVGEGIRLNSNGGSYEINELNLDISSVSAISSGGNSSLTITASQ
jgi:hypothetical protein